MTYLHVLYARLFFAHINICYTYILYLGLNKEPKKKGNQNHPLEQVVELTFYLVIIVMKTSCCLHEII